MGQNHTHHTYTHAPERLEAQFSEVDILQGPAPATLPTSMARHGHQRHEQRGGGGGGRGGRGGEAEGTVVTLSTLDLALVGTMVVREEAPQQLERLEPL